MPPGSGLDTSRRLLRPKLLPPRVPTDLVARPDLVAQLEHRQDRRLTLLVAPAGYGKTTLLTAWLMETSSPAAYLALDEYDADPTVFLLACVEALQSVAPDFGGDTLALLRLSARPSMALLAATLAAEAVDLPEPVALVLDDYQTLNSPDVDKLLTELLRHLPAPLHLVIATRQEPALPLARLRARAELMELRADDLRFDHDHARAFLARLGQAEIEPEVLAALVDRTEGWPAGLRLAGLALAGAPHTDGRTGTRDDAVWRFARDFLINDVLAAQEPAVQRFLLETAILDRLCAPLCDAVLANPAPTGSSQATLDLLARRGLFIVRLTEDGAWYRYHSLFQDALLSRLQATYEPGAITALRQRASAWLAAEGRVSDAVRQALAADDQPAAAAIVESRVDAALGREAWPEVEEWLRLLPPALVRGRPALLIAHAWLNYLHFRLAAIPPIVAVAAALLDRPDIVAANAAEGLGGDLDALESIHYSEQGQPDQAWDAAWRALSRIPVTRAYPRGVVAALLARMAPAVGESARLVAELEQRLATSSGVNPYNDTRVRGGLGFLYLELGDLPRLKEVAELLLQEATGLDLQLAAAWCHYWLGRVHYEWNDLATAEAHFTAVHAARARCHFLLLRNAMHGLALAQQAQGRTDAAEQTVATLRFWVAELQDRAQLMIEDAFAARLALLRGDLAPAESWLQCAALLDAPRYVQRLEVPELTRVRALVARGTRTAAHQAVADVGSLLPRYEARHDALRVGELLGLQALAQDALGATPAALDTLERALDLAAPAGRVRVFVDLGAPMARLLALYAARRETTPYVERLLAACGASAAPETPAPLPLVEPLTWREGEVLHLLGARLTNKEIARRLQISPTTAKKHTLNIYQKLGVNGRRHAVTQALALGLLPPSLASEPGGAPPPTMVAPSPRRG